MSGYLEWPSHARSNAFLARAANCSSTAFSSTFRNRSPLRTVSPCLHSADLGTDDLDVLWDQLGREDAAPAYKALWRMVAHQNAVPFLRQRLRPVPHEQVQDLNKLLDKLNDKSSIIREEAARELTRLASRFEPWLRQALASSQDPEVRRHLQSIVRKLEREELQPADLQESRTVQLLESLGTEGGARVSERDGEGYPGGQTDHGSPGVAFTPGAQVTLILHDVPGKLRDYES